MFDSLFRKIFPHYHTLTEEEKSKVSKKTFTFFLVAALILCNFCTALWLNQDRDDIDWQETFTVNEKVQKDLEETGKNATKVLCGTYVDNLYNIDMANGTFCVSFLTWFRWDGDDIDDMANHFRIYKGSILSKNIVKDYKLGDTHYQLVRCDIRVAKSFWTKGFPIDTHQLSFYIEPFYTAMRVVLVPDIKNSIVNRNIHISGFRLEKSAIASSPYEYRNNRGDVELGDLKNVSSEIVTGMQIKRDGLGLYVKCFIGLFGCLIWALIILYINIYHRVDPLSMIPGALFGCVANIMVGASLLPDALEMGLLEYVNMWGIFIILSVAVVVINVNDIRRKQKEEGKQSYYAAVYGRLMFYVVTAFAVLGNFLMPALVYFEH